MSKWSSKEVTNLTSLDHFNKLTARSTSKLTLSITYIDVKGKHINITIDNPGKIQALDLISVLTKEVKDSRELPIKQKKEQIEVIDRIAKEAFSPEPNKTLLRALSEGLASIFKSSPGMDKAENDAKSLTSLFSNLA